MKITLKDDAVSGSVQVPKGEYWVALVAEQGQAKLVAGGKEITVPVMRRTTRTKTKRLTIIFTSGGGSLWSLVISKPNSGEWVALFDMGKGKSKSTAPKQDD